MELPYTAIPYVLYSKIEYILGRIKKCTNGQINFYLREKLPLHLSRIIRNLDPKNKLILPLRFYSFDVSLSHN